jgi:hypothetical protein
LNERESFRRRLLRAGVDGQVRKRPGGRMVQSLPEASCPIIDDILAVTPIRWRLRHAEGVHID